MDKNSLFNSRWKESNYVLSTKAYYYKTWQGYQMPSLHSHSSIEVMYVIAGKCHIEIENKRVGLTKGQFILIDANVSHRLLVPKNRSCRMLNLEFGFVHDLDSPLDLKHILIEEADLLDFFEHEFSYSVLHDTDMVYSTLKKLIYYLDCSYRKKSLYIQLLHFQLLIDIAYLWKDTIAYAKNGSESHVYKAVEYLHQHYDEDIKIVQLARHVNLNENYLQRLFKEQMDLTIIEYLNRFRLEKAAMFLIETDYTMMEISDMIGLNSRQYFIKLFKDRYSTTPGAYRKSKGKRHGHEMSE
jgi:AraC-like DNA-binding protein